MLRHESYSRPINGAPHHNLIYSLLLYFLRCIVSGKGIWCHSKLCSCVENRSHTCIFERAIKQLDKNQYGSVRDIGRNGAGIEASTTQHEVPTGNSPAASTIASVIQLDQNAS